MEPPLKKYIKVFSAWLFFSSLLGFGVAMFAAGRGGASVIFAILGFFVGLIGGTVHAIILAFWKGDVEGKVLATALLATVIGYVLWLWFSPHECNYDESEASAMVQEKLIKQKRSPEYLRETKFNYETCSFSFMYEGPDGVFEYIVSNWGEIGISDYSLYESKSHNK